MIEWISKPWPWYVAGPLIGLTVPALLLLGNKNLGISSSLRHICAACFPGKIPFFQYDWKHEVWNLFFVTGVLLGGFVAMHLISNPAPVDVAPETVADLAKLNIPVDGNLLPASLFSFENLLSTQGFFFFVVGGFMVGFGTRYAGGCTSGHTIMGLSTLQWPSLVASCYFMAGGFVMVHLLFPILLKWL